MKKFLIAALLGCAAMPAQAFTYVKYEAWGEGIIAYRALQNGNWVEGTVAAGIFAEALVPLEGFGCSTGVKCSYGPNGLSFAYEQSNDFTLKFDHPLTGFPLTADGFTGGQANSRAATVSGLKADYIFAQGGGSLSQLRVTVINTEEFLRSYSSVAVTSAVPEPATWAMMIAGFGLAGAAMRRRSARVHFA